jgi:hypothetical protein
VSGVVAAALAGCGSNLPAHSTASTPGNLPNIPQIQSAIGQSVVAKIHLQVRVLCPAIVPMVRGGTFSCLAYATRPRLRTFTFVVKQQGGTFVTYHQTG